ncbi:MAG: hypothetical protein IPK26_03895 [Planctomycetes bacterium]|nr:hypothetical protein [Planctomycetota bacterium]
MQPWLRGVVGFLASGAALVGQAGPADELEVVRSAVRRQESAVGFLRVESWYVSTEGSDDAPQRVAEMHATILREPDPTGMIRVQYHPLVSRGGDGRFWVIEYSRGYNGRVSWFANKSSQIEGQEVVPLRDGDIQPGRLPALAEEGQFDNWAMTLPGFFEPRGILFSQILEIGEAPFEVKDGDHADVCILTCVSRSGKTRDEWVLRRDRAYCCEAYRRYEGATVRRQFTVEESREVVPGFWYPTKGTCRTYDEQGRQILKNAVEVMSVEVLTESGRLFEPEFRRGMVVVDRLTGKAVTIAGEDGELESLLDGQATALRAAGGSRRGGLGLPWWLIVVVVAGLLVIAVPASKALGARRVPRDRVRRRAVAAPLLLATLLGADRLHAQVADDTWVMREMGGARADNCGLNAAYVAARYHGIEMTLAELAETIGIDHARLTAIDLERLRSTFGSLGLECQGYRSPTLEGVAMAVRARQAIGLIHVETGAPTGHYYVIGPAGDQITVVDPGRGVWVVGSSDRLWQRIAQAFSGACLLITRAPDEGKSAWRPASEVAQRLDCGVVADSASVRRLPIVNDGAGALRLLSAKSGCGCFKGAVLEPASLVGGATGELVVTVDGALLPAGKSKQRVSLVFESSGVAKTSVLELSAETRRRDSAAPRGVIPTVLRSVGESGGRSSSEVSVVHPAGGLVADIAASPGVTVSESTISVVDSTPAAIARRYVVEWDYGRAGWVDVTIRDAIGQDAVVRCHVR